MSSNNGLMQRLGRAFIVQALLISVAAAASLYLTTVMLEKVMVDKAMQLEADFFWREYSENSNFTLPRTYNLEGYMEGRSDNIPDSVKYLGLGVHRLKGEDENSVVHISERHGEKLYLVFNRKQVGTLIALYGLLPLACVLIILYLSLWVTYRISSRTLSPITWLARKVKRLDPRKPSVSEFALENLPADANDEVKLLTKAIHSFAVRLDNFVKREGNFTRDASHELRTPLTVINIASDVLLLEKGLSTQSRESINRIKRACADMEELTEVFLMLARESECGDITQNMSINKLVVEEIEQARFLAIDKPVELKVLDEYELTINGSARVVSVLLGNLLRNAISYTEQGNIQVLIGPGYVEIEDTGPGIAEDQIDRLFQPYIRGQVGKTNGYGVGLTIVKRISGQFDWPIKVESSVGKGTRVRVLFNSSQYKKKDSLV